MDESIPAHILTQSDWMAGAQCLWTLDETEVHLWRVDLATADTIRMSHLSEDEQARAGRFRNDVDRTRYIARRQALRELLARYGNTDPRRIRFERTQYGKPMAFGKDDDSLAHFSSSSSGHLALIAVATSSLGVDVERVTTDVEIDRVASSFFHADEAAEIQAHRGDSKRARFFHCWTRKEAYVKAVGRGLDLGLDQFRVTANPKRAELLWRAPTIGDDTAWMIHAIELDEDYAGALCQRRQDARVCCYKYT